MASASFTVTSEREEPRRVQHGATVHVIDARFRKPEREELLGDDVAQVDVGLRETLAVHGARRGTRRRELCCHVVGYLEGGQRNVRPNCREESAGLTAAAALEQSTDARFHHPTSDAAPARVHRHDGAALLVGDEHRDAVGRAHAVGALHIATAERITLESDGLRSRGGRVVKQRLASVYLRQEQNPLGVHSQERARPAQIFVDGCGLVPDGGREAQALERPFGRSAHPREEGMPKAGPGQKWALQVRGARQADLPRIGRPRGYLVQIASRHKVWYCWVPMRPKDPFIGRELLGGQFRVLEKVGTGGMGSVYKAEQPAMNRMVAIKILHPKLAGRKDLTSRFRREARAMSQLTHPNTVKVFMYGELEDDGSLYIVMEMLEGRNLNQTVRKEGPMAADRAITILIQVCGALQEAHDLGIVHRDLKPENIFLSKQGGISDYPKVLDFGLAKVTERQMQPGSVILTQEGMVFGTPEFMSPEQAQGKTLDARSDIYSLAVILYEVLTGKLPFSARTPMEYIQKHVTDPIIPLSERVPDRKFPKGLDDVLAKALEKQPDKRYQTAGEFGEALRPFGGEKAKALPPVGPVAASAAGEIKAVSQRAATRGGGPNAKVLVGVAAVCLLAGVLIAVVVMRVLAH